MPLSDLGIVNGSRFSVQDGALDLPDMRETLEGFSRAISLVQVTTQIVDFQAKQIERPINAFGIIQPLSTRELTLKPEGQRAWPWMVVLANTDLSLKPDDVVFWKGKRYRIMGIWDWEDNGYMRYEMVGDYDNATTPRK